MVRLVYEKTIDREEMYSLLKKYEIICYGSEEIKANLCYLTIDSKALREESLCVLGKSNYMYTEKGDRIRAKDLKDRPNRDAALAFAKMAQDRVKKKTLRDVSFWHSFICAFVNEFKMVGLERYYENYDIPCTRRKRIVYKLTLDDLLRIDVNQTLFVATEKGFFPKQRTDLYFMKQ